MKNSGVPQHYKLICKYTMAHVPPTITDSLPITAVEIHEHFKFKKADTSFNMPALIVVFLGSDIAPKIFK